MKLGDYIKKEKNKKLFRMACLVLSVSFDTHKVFLVLWKKIATIKAHQKKV